MFPRFNPEDCNYSDAHRCEMEEVLDNWKLWNSEENVKVLQNYLCGVNTNTHGLYESAQDILTELRILRRIDSMLDADEHEFLLACYLSKIKLARAKQQEFKMKAAMLDF
ncbi:uncharacterized protein LOC113277266 [Papaver somniferum]|uniref:uncharacterized protein LOC113277266 n=1 Tax=Papaver somniferum TaxID=3469 RepID=UPI000E7017F6|nr:uncharacterized protein LOC113277266 [Papaver somniferum]